MNKKNFAKKFILISLCLLIATGTFLTSTHAQTSDDIQDQIDEKQEELKKLEAELKEKENGLGKIKLTKSTAGSELALVELEIEELSAEIKLIEVDLLKQQTDFELKSLQVEREEKQQSEQLVSLYMSWKGQNAMNVLLSLTDDPIEQVYYQEIAAETDQKGLNTSLELLDSLEDELESIRTKKEELNAKSQELEARKNELAKALEDLQRQESSYASGIGQLKPKIVATQTELEFLSKEQKAMQDIESGLIGGGGSTGQQPLEKGKFYFSGQGRDLYQGHGVGMSQYGAYGAASKGWSAQSILEFYYVGAKVTSYLESAMITIWYCPNSPQGLTPPSCNGSAPVYKRISLNDYLGGLGEMPESWPIEARKAQMIAARTYALRQTDNGSESKPICITTSCQVNYIRSGSTDDDFMDNGDLQVAIDTQGKVVTYNGGLISAVYSSDNNQGWGTADNDTVWSNYSGDGTPYPYLRARNDLDFASRTSWSNWTYRTNSYSIDQFNAWLNFSSTSGAVASGSRNFMASTKTAIGGSITAFEFVKDPSSRVKKVKIIGPAGSKYIAGWLFKSLWNVWVGTDKPSGEVDYIYSLTFNFNQV